MIVLVVMATVVIVMLMILIVMVMRKVFFGASCDVVIQNGVLSNVLDFLTTNVKIFYHNYQ